MKIYNGFGLWLQRRLHLKNFVVLKKSLLLAKTELKEKQGVADRNALKHQLCKSQQEKSPSSLFNTNLCAPKAQHCKVFLDEEMSKEHRKQGQVRASSTLRDPQAAM